MNITNLINKAATPNTLPAVEVLDMIAPARNQNIIANRPNAQPDN